ncbi:unnamed protein product [Mytilus coruscus]|uniref:Uncharacterized protein n=1 Tax=Mytilus coruscus TaxID=42192 RepID=A0A6J8ED86_MYTCO|nr:unnamed protein product [Mytilus coruscus]
MQTSRKKSCKAETPTFMCFRDINEHVFNELCWKSEEYQPEGVPFDDKHFQPSHTVLPMGTRVSLKSSCNEVGQIVSDDELTKSDRTCRCDYRFGYSFVTRPSGTCFCKSFREDCSCYYKNCKKDQVLSSDYYCIDRDNITVNFRCPWIGESTSKKSTETETKNVIKSTDEGNLTCIIGMTYLQIISVLINSIGTCPARYLSPLADINNSCPQHTLVDAMRTQAVVIVIGISLVVPRFGILCDNYKTELGVSITLESKLTSRGLCDGVYWMKY